MNADDTSLAPSAGSFSYQAPNGEVIQNCTVENLVRIIVSAKSAYWKRGSGSGIITYSTENGVSSILVVMCRPRFGFYFLYQQKTIEKTQSNPSYVALAHEDFEQKVSLFTGGDFLLVPKAVFLTKAAATQIISEFCNTGDKYKEALWEQHPLGVGDDEIYGDPY